MYYADLYDLKTVISAYSLFMKPFLSIAAATIVLTVVFYLVPHILIHYNSLLP